MSWRDAVQSNRRAVMRLSSPDMSAIMSILHDVRDQTAEALTKFLKDNAGSEYQLHKHRSLLLQLDKTLKIVEKELPADTLKDLKKGSKVATKTAVKLTEDMIREGEKKFRGTTTTLRIPVAKVLTRVDRTLIGRLETKSSRYAGEVGNRIRRELAIGVVRGESVDQMAKRLLGERAHERLKSRPAKMADKIADKQLFRNEADATRLVRTELANAYTESQLESLDEANEDDPGWKKRWDAANDWRVCKICFKLHDVVVDLNKNFPGEVQGPPIHPNDRCCVVPHRDEWPKNTLTW